MKEIVSLEHSNQAISQNLCVDKLHPITLLKNKYRTTKNDNQKVQYIPKWLFTTLQPVIEGTSQLHWF